LNQLTLLMTEGTGRSHKVCGGAAMRAKHFYQA